MARFVHNKNYTTFAVPKMELGASLTWFGASRLAAGRSAERANTKLKGA